jgi:hypothetical protein
MPLAQVTLKIMTILPYSVDVIASLCADLKRRREWDLKFHIGKRLAKLDANSDVRYHYSLKANHNIPCHCHECFMTKIFEVTINGGVLVCTGGTFGVQVIFITIQISRFLFVTIHVQT